LHDTLEDTETTQDELTDMFGERVCKIVLELSDNKDLPKQVRKQLQIKHAPHISHEAKTVKLADKISNIRDVVENPAMGWSIERRIEYVEWGVAVAEGLRGANASLEEHFDRLIERSRSHLAAEKDLGGTDG
jgi:guanosine-3',5'-bis(diphosphate) 3'-pyrophosphohydrolase